jgi:hypothetical protein
VPIPKPRSTGHNHIPNSRVFQTFVASSAHIVLSQPQPSRLCSRLSWPATGMVAASQSPSCKLQQPAVNYCNRPSYVLRLFSTIFEFSKLKLRVYVRHHIRVFVFSRSRLRLLCETFSKLRLHIIVFKTYVIMCENVFVFTEFSDLNYHFRPLPTYFPF